MKLLVLTALTVIACTDHSEQRAPRENASRAFAAATHAIESAAARLDEGSRVAPLTGSVALASTCTLAGSIDIAGTYEATDTGSSWDLEADFNSCQENEGVLDGELRWRATAHGNGYTDSLIGVLRFTDAYGEWECEFDLHTTSDATGYSYSGTACGYDVESEL